MSFRVVNEFEKTIASYFGAPFGVAVDCCTHGLELALRYTKADRINIPKNTYPSVPMLSTKLNISRMWRNEQWKEYYTIAPGIIDAAVLWRPDSYVEHTLMVLSFQFKKHLNLGRGGLILTDNMDAWTALKKMSYDGRDPNSDIPWADQEITQPGYHYYMTPETAKLGISKFPTASKKKAEIKTWEDYPDLLTFKVFKNG